MSLQVSNLSVSRGGRTLLEGVTFDVDTGHALILRGPNGLGKTTLLRTLAGLQKPEAGTVHLPEEDAVYAGHLDGIKATLTVRENLMFWARVFGTQSIDRALRTFDLSDLLDRSGGMLSAGQKRRLGLARLMVTGRKFWMLDEPTVSLDQASVAQFADMIRAHLASGGSAIMATHIDLGLGADVRVLDLSAFRATTPKLHASEEAFL
ncbi:MAG: heme ABC exporter ATP-binding protein CcmA [Rhodobacteraceae bacterium]|jgi:heme exporter protein A|nr:heme ABC exporter ATP-binding protein CcmA [Paracoccaceae bacterium]